MLKLEVGKFYRSRSGAIFNLGANNCNIYPFNGISPDYEYLQSFTETGKCSALGDRTDLDLVAEVPYPFSLPTQGPRTLWAAVAEQIYLAESVPGGLEELYDAYLKSKNQPPEMCINHSAVDTGMTNSWCKHCDINMEFNRDTGKYRVRV